jgi:hypothetical protein
VTGLSDTERAFLKSLGLTERQHATVLQAIDDAPTGAWVVIREAREYGRVRGNTGAGLLMHRLGRGEHFDVELELDGSRRRRTGWKLVRGSHAYTYVPDPDGTDAPPSQRGSQLEH